MNIFKRSKNNPILKPDLKNDWENFKLYNPGAVFDGEKYHIFYRAMNRGEEWRSSIGHATSIDGENWERFDEPALKAETPEEKRGLEDPRITKIGNKYFMAYAAYDGEDVRLCIATSNDCINWKKQGPALKDFIFLKNGGQRLKYEDGKIQENNKRVMGKERSKSGALFSEKINGKYWMLFGEFNVWLASSDDGLKWDVPDKPFLVEREEGLFDEVFVEMGPPPIKTEQGWLILYHGIDKNKTYRLGFLLLDLNDPTKIIYRHNEPIFGPQESYEMTGIVDVIPGGLEKMQSMNNEELKEFLDEAVKNKVMPAVTFCCAAVPQGDDLRIFYGAGDSVICTATGKISEILKLIKS